MTPPAPATTRTDPQTLGALRFGSSWVRVELGQVMSRYWRRSTTVSIALYVLLGAVLPALAGLVGAPAPRIPWVAWSAIGAVAGVVVLTTVIVLIEAVSFRKARRAGRAYFRIDSAGRRGAYISAGPKHTVGCVHASPQGSGLGSEAMRAIIEIADRHGWDLVLKASVPEAISFYQRFGFTSNQPGDRHMTRPAKSKTDTVIQ